jgi:hypothetical protein
MKYMILTYASQQDYDGMAGEASDEQAWSAEDFVAMTSFMEAFNTELADSGELVETRALAAPVHTRRLGAQGAYRSSLTVRTPRPRKCSPDTGSWNATASTARLKSPAGWPLVPPRSSSWPTPTRMCGRSWSRLPR